MALIMNILTEGEPLYRLPEFFQETDTETLFHDGIEPSDLNDDTLGRGLDKLSETGLRMVLGTVLWEAANRETQSPSVIHSDTTTVSVQGAYENSTDESDIELISRLARNYNLTDEMIDTDVVETEEKKSRDSPGRPPKDWDPYKTVYKITVTVQRDEEAINTRKQRKSCFVLITTLTDTDEWSGEDILELYKDQQTVERRFPVLKDPKRVGPVFLNRPDRVEALGYVLILALLVYSLIEQRARRALATADTVVRDYFRAVQHTSVSRILKRAICDGIAVKSHARPYEEPMELAGGPTSFRPTGRRVLERFENMLVIVDEDGHRKIPANVDVPERVLELLDLSVEVYGVEDE